MAKAASFTVALIGPDGAGKTTIARRLERELPMPARYLYMGVNADASNRLLPTTRLVRALKRAAGASPDTGGPPDPTQLSRPRPRGVRRRAFRSVKSGLRLTNQLAEEWYRQLVAWSHVRRGSVVLFDRHFFSDYYAYDVAGGERRSLSRRLHGFALQRLYPKPDLVVYLDAPPEVLLARKGEGTVEALARRRGEYLELASLTPHFAVVDAGRPLDEVVHDVADVIGGYATSGQVGERFAPPRGGS
jgi:thymidylate kinase